MKIRLGYVANALRLENCSPSKTITLKHLNKLEEYNDRLSRLSTISRQNLTNTLRILKANYFDGIAVYRFTSKLIPLCTHPLFVEWDYIRALQGELEEIGEFVRGHNMRVSLHPDHYTLLNSPHPEVKASSLRDLEYHIKILEAMALEEARLVLHVGGKYQDRKAAIKRFKTEYTALPSRIKHRLTLENDDRSFTAAEVLEICTELKIPMVLDLHHHRLLNTGEDLTPLLPAIFRSWSKLLPKVHISSPRRKKNPRHHADYIEVDSVIDFLKATEKLGQDFDLMVEAKKKDLALLKLAEDLRAKGYHLPTTGEILL